MAGIPWFKFHARDWLADDKLSVVSPMTRGVWIDLLARMHEAGTGVFEGTIEAVARSARCSTTEAAEAVRELKASQTSDVEEIEPGRFRLTSRRMVKDIANFEMYQGYGRRGGNPSLKGGVNPSNNPKDKALLISVSDSLTSDSSEGGVGETKPTKAEHVPIPDSLDTVGFREAWLLWLSDRRDRGKKVTARAASMQLKSLSEKGPERAIRTIQNSISNGYQGLYEPAQQRTTANSADARRAEKAAREFPEPDLQIPVLRLGGSGTTGTTAATPARDAR